MKPLRALLGYLAVVFLGAAALAPWVFLAVQHFAPGSGLAHQPFHRYVNRCLLGLALAGIWPLVRALGLKSWAEIGWNRSVPWGREARAGLFFGFVSLALAAVAALAFGGRQWRVDHTAAEWLKYLFNAVGSALLVSVLEELLFRGAVFSALRRGGSFAFSAAVSAGVYALVHFFERPPEPTEVNATTGFLMLGRMLHGFVDLRAVFPGLLTLALAGGLLAWARERTGALWFGMGLHAGWIFWLKSYGFLTVESPTATAALWGSAKLYDGWAALLVLTLVSIPLARRWRARPAAGPAPPSPT
ncbi:MAG TPA: CPBP family glutamic-type intramembrane protease [Candidatus Limnocylindria bacterium]|nr:CPBP family glutamic-type intramembrane protease [Candidatus Limnocylindria bacterium]